MDNEVKIVRFKPKPIDVSLADWPTARLAASPEAIEQGKRSPCYGCCGNIALEGHTKGVCVRCAYAGVKGGIYPGNFLRLPVKPEGL